MNFEIYFIPVATHGLFLLNNKARVDSVGSPSQYVSSREFTLLV